MESKFLEIVQMSIYKTKTAGNTKQTPKTIIEFWRPNFY